MCLGNKNQAEVHWGSALTQLHACLLQRRTRSLDHHSVWGAHLANVLGMPKITFWDQNPEKTCYRSKARGALHTDANRMLNS